MTTNKMGARSASEAKRRRLGRKSIARGARPWKAPLCIGLRPSGAWSFLTLALCILLTGSIPAQAQSRYDWSGIDGNLQPLLEERLQGVQKRPFNEILNKLREDYNIPPDMKLDQFKIDPGWLKEAVEEYKATGKIPEKRALELLKMLHQKIQTPPEQLPNRPAKTPPPPPLPRPKEAKKLDDDFSRWVKEQLENAEDSEFGELLKDSPAFKQALNDLQRYLREGGFDPNLRAPEWTKNFRMPDWNMEESPWWNRLPAWTPPELPRFRVRLPKLPRIGGGLPSLSLPMPSLSGRGARAMSETVLWLVLFAACGFIVWKLVRRSLAERAGIGATLGPWPVAANKVRTAAELIAAFEYLGLLRLGAEARSLNHVAIAERLSSLHPAQRQAAGELAALYARARYAPPAEPLQPHAVDAARRHLCALAGVPS